MKKWIASTSLLALLAACQTTPIAEPSASVSTEPEEASQIFNDYFSLNLPAGWLQEEDTALDGPSYFHFDSQVMLDGYSCDEDLASVMISPQMYVDPNIPMNFDELALSREVYEAQGAHLGVFGGEAEQTTLGGKPAYHYAEAGIEAPCSASGYLVNDGDYIFNVTYFAQPGGEAEKEMQTLIDSIQF